MEDIQTVTLQDEHASASTWIKIATKILIRERFFLSCTASGNHIMKNISTRIYAIALLFILISTINSAIGSTVIPKQFSASIGGAMDGYYHLELHNDTLIYTDPNRPSTPKGRVTIRPTTKQWREFKQTLDDLNIWQWQSNYRSRVVDGTQ